MLPWPVLFSPPLPPLSVNLWQRIWQLATQVVIVAGHVPTFPR